MVLGVVFIIIIVTAASFYLAPTVFLALIHSPKNPPRQRSGSQYYGCDMDAQRIQVTYYPSALWLFLLLTRLSLDQQADGYVLVQGWWSSLVLTAFCTWSKGCQGPVFSLWDISDIYLEWLTFMNTNKAFWGSFFLLLSLLSALSIDVMSGIAVAILCFWNNNHEVKNESAKRGWSDKMERS